MNFFAVMLVVACLFNTTALSMTRAEQDREKNLFVYLEHEIDSKKENDLTELRVSRISDDKDSILKFEYDLGVGMVHTPFKNKNYATHSAFDNNGVVTFYYGNPPAGKTRAEFVASATDKATGYLYVRASWDIEHKWYAMVHPNFANDPNNQRYKVLLAELIEQIERNQLERAFLRNFKNRYADSAMMNLLAQSVPSES